jgi:hypothetical protein
VHGADEPGTDGLPAHQLIDGRFKLLARIGSGRLGEIYEARVEGMPDDGSERLVALQLFHRRIAADRALIDKLRRGYAALRAGPHRDIVRLDELGRDRQTWYLVMERLEGASLRFVLGDVGSLPPEEAMAIVRAVGDALAYLHAKDMVHGALTPSAVFVTEDFAVRLLDIVPVSSSDLLDATVPTAADDVYGLACLTYQLLTGRHPYNYVTDSEAHRLGLKPAVIGGLPPMRWKALERGLAPERANRPSSVQVFLVDLGIPASKRLTSAGEAPVATGGPSVAASGSPIAVGGPPIAVAPADDLPIVTTPGDRWRLLPPPAERRQNRWLWSGFGAAVVGLLAAVIWVYQIPIRDVAIEQLATVGIDLNAGGDGDGAGESARDDASTAVDGDVARIDLPAESEAISEPRITPESELDPELELVTEADSELEIEPEPAPAPEAVVADTSALAPDPQVTASRVVPEARIGVETPGAAESSPDGDPGATTEQESESRFTVAEGLRVEEGDAAAAITISREGGIAARTEIVWWTSEDTARAGADYIDFGEQTEWFEPGVESLTLLIPLVDDGLAEPLEGFLVTIGQPDPAPGRVNLISTVGVIIRDDDTRTR